MSEPVAKAILLAEAVIEDRQNRRSLINTFDTASLGRIPGPADPFWVFVRVADAPGQGSFTVQVEDPAGVALFTSGAVLYGQRPGSRGLEVVCKVASILFPKAGTYRVACFLNSERVAETSLDIRQAVPEGAPAPETKP